MYYYVISVMREYYTGGTAASKQQKFFNIEVITDRPIESMYQHNHVLNRLKELAPKPQLNPTMIMAHSPLRHDPAQSDQDEYYSTGTNGPIACIKLPVKEQLAVA